MGGGRGWLRGEESCIGRVAAPYHHHHRFVAGCLPGHTDQSNLNIRLYIGDIQTTDYLLRGILK